MDWNIEFLILSRLNIQRICMHFQFLTFLQSMIGQLTFSTPGSARNDFYSRVAVIQYTDSAQKVRR